MNVCKTKVTLQNILNQTQAYDDWQSNPTQTLLETAGMPISKTEFPSITICAQGSIHEVIPKSPMDSFSFVTCMSLQSLSDIVTTSGPRRNGHNIQ